MELTAKTFQGLEQVLADELTAIGAEEVKTGKRAVHFKGGLDILYKANYTVRSALSILCKVHSFKANDERELYNKVRDFDWTTIIDNKKTFAITSTVHSNTFNHSKYVALKTKDAIVDQFRDKFGRRPNIDRKRPDVLLNVKVNEHDFIISMDSSGDPLFKRGYRTITDLAPINEVLAAGLLLKTKWDPTIPFVDPMCGSGTFIIEAALLGQQVPSGYFRKRFGFQKWNNYRKSLWLDVKAQADEQIRKIPLKIYGGDNSGATIRKTRINLANLEEFGEKIKLQISDISEFLAPEGPGVLLTNPPYGQRIKIEKILDLYQEMGDAFKNQFNGYDCYVISSEMDALKFVGLKTSMKERIFNGPLECSFRKYEIYKGSKKEK